MRLVKEQQKQLKKYFEKENDINAAYIFGSFGTEKETALSDIDFAVLFKKSGEVGMQREMQIMAQLTLLLKKEDIDLLNLNQAPVCLQHQVIKTGDLIYKSNQKVVTEFVEHVLTFYYDERIRSKEFYRVYKRSLKEEYGYERKGSQ